MDVKRCPECGSINAVGEECKCPELKAPTKPKAVKKPAKTKEE